MPAESRSTPLVYRPLHAERGRKLTSWPGLGVIALIAVLSTLWVAAGPASAGQSCFGRTATITARPGVVTHGTSGNDVIVGTSGDDVIHGHGGSDLICSGAGNDRVSGGYGRDVIDLGQGADFARGGPGADYIQGGPGKDTIRGKRGADTIRGDGGADTCSGGQGSDQLYSCNEKPASTTNKNPPPATAGPADLSGVEAQMVKLVNDLRVAQGRKPLTVSSEMSKVARTWSKELTNGFRHNSNVSSQIPSGWRAWGENIAYNVSIVADFNALVNSPGHLANMVDSNFTHVGVGVYVDGSRVYVTQIFARY